MPALVCMYIMKNRLLFLYLWMKVPISCMYTCENTDFYSRIKRVNLPMSCRGTCETVNCCACIHGELMHALCTCRTEYYCACIYRKMVRMCCMCIHKTAAAVLVYLWEDGGHVLCVGVKLCFTVHVCL